MSNFTFPLLSRALGFALAVVLMPLAVSAQQQDRAQDRIQQTPQCSMDASPVEVSLGQTAIDVTVEVPQDFGPIAAVQPSSDSGLSMASAEDIPRAELAAGEEDPTPIQMSAEGSAATIWLNTENAREGDHQIVVQGSSGMCTAQVRVAG